MKTKRCTNSSCRKVFRVESHECPHCGKKYPRGPVVLIERKQTPPTFSVPVENNLFMVVLTFMGYSKLAVIKAIQPYTGLHLRDRKTLVDNCPSLIQTGVSLSQAVALQTAICDAGSDAMFIPVSRGTRGIFVLPEQAG